MNNICDHKACPAEATHVIFIKTGCITLCDHHTRSLRRALNRKGYFIAPIAALSHSEKVSLLWGPQSASSCTP
jgi:hypothetical protein